MARTGPQRYPGADQSHRYQGVYGGDAMEVNVVVLHTTEGRTLPGYGGGASAPNLTAVPDLSAKKLKWYQHFDIETSSRALVNKPGGVATNTLNVCQVELVGTCDPVTHRQWGAAPHVYWPEAPEWALAELAVFLRWMHEQHGVPLTGPKAWPAYPSSYGATAARFDFAEWHAFAGICGHMHVPENDHGDPGSINFARLLTLAKGTTTEEDNVALTTEDIDKVALATANKLIAGGGVLENSDVRRIAEAVEAKPVVLTDAQVQALAASPVLAEAIAERVAAKLAARLAN